MVTKKVLLYFPKSETDQPIVYRLVKDYSLEINIFRAKVTPQEYGYLVLDMTGKESDIQAAMTYIESLGVEVNGTDKGLAWNADVCTHCGHCIPHCPTQALSFDNSKSRKVTFDITQCIDCLSCVKNCPFGACTSIFMDDDR